MNKLRICPCCGKKFNPLEGDIIEFGRNVGSDVIASQDITKGILINRKIGEIKTIVERIETYACRECANKFWNIKRTAKIFSIFVLVLVIVLLPIIGWTNDMAWLIVGSVFALIFVRSFYEFLYDTSAELLAKIFARGRNLTPDIKQIVNCRTHPAQVENEIYNQEKPPINEDDNSDLPF